MNKELALRLIKLLSAIESFGYQEKQQMFPDYLHEDLGRLVDELTEIVLK